MGGEGRESGSLWGYRSMVKLPARAPSPLRELIRFMKPCSRVR